MNTWLIFLGIAKLSKHFTFWIFALQSTKLECYLKIFMEPPRNINPTQKLTRAENLHFYQIIRSNASHKLINIISQNASRGTKSPQYYLILKGTNDAWKIHTKMKIIKISEKIIFMIFFSLLIDTRQQAFINNTKCYVHGSR